MNEERRFEDDVAAVFTERAPTHAPEHLLTSVIYNASRRRKHPRWLALLKEPPMRVSNNIAVGSPTVRVAAIMAATLLLAILVAGAGIAGSRLLAADATIVVDPSGDGTVTTITEAVAMAEDGDLILVRPGTYDESIVLTKDITIRGDGDGDGDGIVIEPSVEIPQLAAATTPDLPFAFLLDGSDAILENLTFRGESARIVINGGAPLLQGLFLDGIGRVKGLDLGTDSVPFGLEFSDGTTATIQDSVLTDVDIDIDTGSSPTIVGNKVSIGAILMQGAGVDPVIRENVLDSSVKWGISIRGGAKPTVEANTIADAETGIEIVDAGYKISDRGTDAVIAGNTITGSTFVGINVTADVSASILNNVLLDNVVGMNVQSDAIIEGNSVENGIAGIVVSFRSSPSLIDNSVKGVGNVGIAIGANTSPTLRGNTACDNGTNLKIVEGATPDIDDTNEICADTLAD